MPVNPYYDNYLGVFHIARGDISCFRFNALFTTCDFIVEKSRNEVVLPLLRKNVSGERN